MKVGHHRHTVVFLIAAGGKHASSSGLCMSEVKMQWEPIVLLAISGLMKDISVDATVGQKSIHSSCSYHYYVTDWRDFAFYFLASLQTNELLALYLISLCIFTCIYTASYIIHFVCHVYFSESALLASSTVSLPVAVATTHATLKPFKEQTPYLLN